MTNDWTKNIDWTEEPLYFEIARAMAEAIENGCIEQGERLPTHRKLATDLGVAIGTVTRAYSELEQRGLVHGSGRRGTIAGQSKGGKVSLFSLTDAPSSFVDFTINYPPLFCKDEFISLFDEMKYRDGIDEVFRYQSPQGLYRHRETGVEWLKSIGLDTTPDSVIMIAGAQHGLNVVFSAITEPGDTVLAENMSYPGIKAVAEVRKLKLVGIQTDDLGIVPEFLESACKKRKVKALYTIPTLQNPTNTILPLERREKIAELAEKYNFNIVEDDIHRGLVEKPPPAFASIAPERTYMISSLSKIVSGGMRVGYMKVPQKSHTLILQTLQALVWNVSPITFEMLTILQEKGVIDKIIKLKRKEAIRRNQLAEKYFNEFNPTINPFSSFFFVNLPGDWTQMQFCTEAHRRGVALAPAEIYSINEKDAPHAVRICHGAPEDYEVLKEGLIRLRRLMRERPPVFSPIA